MTGPTSAMEPVEPQSLKKLSFKSLKRALDLFSPLHAHFPLRDPDSKKIRMSHKFNDENGGIKSASSQPLTHAKSGSQDQAREGSGPSNALALPGPENSKDPQNGGALIDLIVGTTVKTKGPKKEREREREREATRSREMKRRRSNEDKIEDARRSTRKRSKIHRGRTTKNEEEKKIDWRT